MYLQLRDDRSGSDLTIVPVHVNMHTYLKLRRGYQLKMGWTQEMAWEFGDLELSIG